ncbi:MAG: DUF499 domain-containing protein [Nitrospiraceae bacterium]|nr:DUF499 domain-containing protein [Nitrospiraceae bacterium]
MRPFHTIAVPHRDILEGRLTMDVFAADLWEVYKGRGPDEYKDGEQFFRKTYQTAGLKNILAIVEKRLSGMGGDPVIQIQTPFGGGKTHTLIAMYHKADQWNARKVVIVGTPMSTSDTPWGMLEEQLTGRIDRFTVQVSPGREAIYELLSENQPVLILMDEVLEYVTKVAAVKVGESTLAAQTLAFMQELTEVAGTLEKVVLVITLPTSTMEHYDESAEKLFGQLKKVTGRVEKIYAPVQDHEITQVIRQRLFSRIDHDGAGEIIMEFMDYATKESILPAGTEPSEYRKRFESSYPFLPEVVDVLYHRWGSFPDFQRTRGVLRLLALITHSLKDKSVPYISIADFDLNDPEIRRELVKFAGPEYDSIIDADITGRESGSRKVDLTLGDTYKGLKLGTRAATTIFLYSFSGSGGTENGATMGEIKRNATAIGNPASVVAEAVEQLKGMQGLLYLQHQTGKYYFTNKLNLNRTLLIRMENISDSKIAESELELLKNNISGESMKVFVWSEKNTDIPDTTDLKLIIQRARDDELLKDTMNTRGHTPRVNRNTLFFLTPLESERTGFYNLLKKEIAYRLISDDKTQNLSGEQKNEIKAELKNIGGASNGSLRRYYRLLAIPIRDGFKEQDLGIPTYGEAKKLDDLVYEKLRTSGEVLERIAPLAIKERYLKDAKFVLTEQLYQSSARTPGEVRIVRREVWEDGISEGVREGLFGLGELAGEEPVCRFFGKSTSVALSGSEVIIREDLCIAQGEATDDHRSGYLTGMDKTDEAETCIGDSGTMPPIDQELTVSGKESVRKKIHLKFTLPKGKVTGIMGIMNLLQSNFDRLEIELLAEGGEISESDYDNKIEEAFRQLEIKLNNNA